METAIRDIRTVLGDHSNRFTDIEQARLAADQRFVDEQVASAKKFNELRLLISSIQSTACHSASADDADMFGNGGIGESGEAPRTKRSFSEVACAAARLPGGTVRQTAAGHGRVPTAGSPPRTRGE